MDRTEFRPCQWYHTACAIKFHCATAERGHGMNQRKVFGLEMVDVTEHLSLRMMFVENWMREILRSSSEGFRDG